MLYCCREKGQVVSYSVIFIFQVVTLHRRLGKPIPEIKIPAITNSTTAKAAASIAQKEGKVVVQVRVVSAILET